MFCSIYKWLISRALDSEKPLSGPAIRHLRRCTSCREFAEFSGSLEDRCAKDIPGFLDDYNEALNKKIISALAKHPEPKSAPARRLFRRPAFAAASAVLVISVSIVWLIVSSSDKITPLDQLSKLSISKASLENMSVKIESPFEAELVELKQTLKSTADFLLSRLDFEIGEREE